MVRLVEIFASCQGGKTPVEKLQEWHLIPTNYPCPKCKNLMRLVEAQHRPDGWQWFCAVKKGVGCGNRVSLRSGTFFAWSKLTIFQILGFSHMWARGLKLVDAMHELDIKKWDTACDWASFCREVCLDAYMNHSSKLGGPDRTVEIDESKFGRRKYHRGHRVDGCWVFGGVEKESGRVFMEVVENRKAETLIPLLEKWVEKGTTVISDCWKAYEGFEHLKVNHSLNFKDPETGAHTNSIEAREGVFLISWPQKGACPG